MSKISIPQKSEVMSFGHWSKKIKTVPVSGIDIRRFLGWQTPTLHQGILGLASPYASSSGLILSARVSKHTDQFIEELLINTEGKTSCKKWLTDDWRV